MMNMPHGGDPQMGPQGVQPMVTGMNPLHQQQGPPNPNQGPPQAPPQFKVEQGQPPQGPPQHLHVYQTNPGHGPPQGPPQQQIGPGGENRFDQISKVRALVNELKVSLANLMKIAASNINHNSQIDCGLKANQEKVARFDKALEDFFGLCNQIEALLKSINESAIQHRDSLKYLQGIVPHKNDNTGQLEFVGPEGTMSLPQFLNTIKGQITFVQSIQEVLTEGARRILTNEPPPPPTSMPMTPGPPSSQV